MKTTSGIYQIRNTVNGKRYIGSALNLNRRWSEHLSLLVKGHHHSRHLQSAWNKHGTESFLYEVLLICKKEDLIIMEQQFIDSKSPEYNISPTAGSPLGVKHSDKSRANMAAGQKGRIHSEDTKIKMSIAHKGDKAHWFGKKLSVDHKAKLSESHMGHIPTLAAREKMSASIRGGNHPMYGKHHSDETKIKLSIANGGENHPFYGKNRSDETKHKISVQNRGGKNGQSKLNMADVLEMKKIRFETGLSYPKIAARYGVSEVTARRAIKGERWGWIDHHEE